MPPKGVVILGAGLLQKPLVDAAKARGWYTIVADKNPGALAAQSGDLFLEIPGNDPAALAKALEPHRGKFNRSATLGTDLSFFMATINEAFGLPGVNTRQALVATHKGRMREFLKEHDIRQPEFIISTNKEELAAFMNDHPGPCVIKPVRNMGARGVLYLKHPGDLSFALEYALSHSATNEIILEQYIEADEFSIDALCIDGKTYATGIADRIIQIKEGRFFIETGHTMPSRFPKEITHQVTEVVARFANALSTLSEKPYTGALKGDIRLGKDQQIYVGEIAARLSGGFMSTHTYPGASGHSLVEGYLDLLEGKTPEFISKDSHEIYPQVTIERAVIAPPGRLKSLSFDIPESPKNSEARLDRTFIHYQEGDIVQPLRSNVGKLANFIISAPTHEQAEALAQEIIEKRFAFEMEPPFIDDTEIKRRARQVFRGDVCRVCKVCDGVRCSSGVPGMGGVGEMNLFRKNIEALAQIRIQKEPLALGPAALVVKEPASEKMDQNPPVMDLSTPFCNTTAAFPILPAPITGMMTNLGGAITEFEYATETRAAAEQLDVTALYGDGASPDKYLIGLEAIRQGFQEKKSRGGCLIIKPRRDNREIIERVQAAEKAGAAAWGIDIDAVGIQTMKNKNQATSRKSLSDLQEISAESDLPFLIKGVNTLAEAEMAARAGAWGVVISNHGGRVDDTLAPSAETLKRLAPAIKKDFPFVSIWVDGGIRSGGDVFKMLALGADGVLVGRPFAIAIAAYGRFGGASLLLRYRNELLEAMRACKVKTKKEITSEMISSTPL